MKIEIVKERRKTISLKVIDSQNAVLKAPKRASAKEIEDFLKSKEAWLARAANLIYQQENFAKSLDFGNSAYLFGQKVGEFFDLISGFEAFSAEKKAREIKKFYLAHFDLLKAKVEEISLKTGLKYMEVLPISSVRVWGSFNTKKQMKLNFKLLLLPEKLVEYVVCHELCHSLQMNHSPKFWAALQEVCPNARGWKKEISKYSCLLKKDCFLS